ncbi:MAG TPA: TerC family protein [Rhizomicrobium sp.]|nr:TerC family protein [Rhizomicrobium sp.]
MTLDPAIFALFQVILIDIVLAGDNAIVIGMAAAHVPKVHRAKVIFWGLVAAVVLRIALASVTMQLLNIIGLMLAGGILLLWVSWRLYRDLRGAHAHAVDASGIIDEEALAKGSKGVRHAIIQITLADLSMSLDNVLAVAGAAMQHFWVLVVGLLLSIALMGVAATYVAKLLNKHRWIGYAGLLIVVYVALSMIWHGGQSVLEAVA